MEQKNTGRQWKAGAVASIVLCVVLIPIILMNVVMIAGTYLNPDHLPGLFGIKPAIVLSGSMSPVFEPDALIFVRETDPQSLKAGDIICYLQSGTAVTHRIEEVTIQDGQTRFITKGDANNTADRLPVAPEQVEGIYIGKIDGLGGFAMFMQSPAGMIVFIALPVALYLVWDILRSRAAGRKEKARAEALEAELAELKAKQEREAADKI